LEYDAACDRLCNDISQSLFDGPRPVLRIAYAAGRATRALAAAFHHASGRPEDPLWSDAVESIGRFLEVCDASMLATTPALRELRSFVTENADAVRAHFELKLAG
jgi:hypothetical protein